MALNFSEVKLKKTEIKDGSKPNIEWDEEHVAAFNKLREKIRQVDVENWVEQLQGQTMQSKILPLSRAEGCALAHCYESSPDKLVKTITKAEEELISLLQERIEETIKGFKGGAAFVKFSSRSPKDATLLTLQTRSSALSLLQSKEWESSLGYSSDSSIDKVIASVLQGAIDTMKVENGKEALSLLSTSRRIYDDITLELDGKTEFDMSIIVREWIPLPVHFEFRGFVYNQTLTALSQYNYVIHYPILEKYEEVIPSRIKDYFYNVIKPLLPHLNNYIIDFAFTSLDPSTSDLIVIEINPYNDYEGNGTSPCLFCWNADRSLLENVNSFEFRIKKEKFTTIPSFFGDPMRNLITYLQSQPSS